MKTEFRPSHEWESYRLNQPACESLIDLVGRTWSEEANLQFHITTTDREDTAESIDEARSLLGSAQFSAATSLELLVFGGSGDVRSLTFSWTGRFARLAVAGNDQLATEILRNKAREILEAGAVAAEDEASTTYAGALVEQQVKLPLKAVRFAGTYADIHRLIRDLADQVREVRGDLPNVYVALTEKGTTITVRHLSGLGEITRRDVKKLTFLSLQLSGTDGGPSLVLFLSRRSLHGRVDGAEEAPARTLRAAANDLLRDRSRGPHWLSMLALSITSALIQIVGLGVSLIGSVRPLGWALFGIGVVLAFNWLYYPEVELLAQDERTRWSRWSRVIVGLVVTWAVGCLAVPIFH